MSCTCPSSLQNTKLLINKKKHRGCRQEDILRDLLFITRTKLMNYIKYGIWFIVNIKMLPSGVKVLKFISTVHVVDVAFVLILMLWSLFVV